jgi:hypothetical protein
MAQEMPSQRAKKQSAQESNQEQDEMAYSPVPRQFGLDRLQLTVLGKLVAFLGSQRVLLPVNPAHTSLSC